MAKFVSLDRLSEFKDKILALLANKVNKSGDTMTGDLIVGSSKVQTNGYLIGKWLQTTETSYLTNANDFAVLNGGWVYKQPPANALKAMGGATVSSFTATVGTSWSGSSAPYTQNITVTGMLATDEPIVDLITTTSGYSTETAEFAKIFKIVTSANKITVYATEKTTSSIQIKLKVVR